MATTSMRQPDTGTAVTMTHREVLEALSGLMLGMFVSILSTTVVANALPRIITDLHGTQSGYTWVVTATMLATTATTPIWGKLADLFSRKILIQLSLLIFVTGSALAGLSESTGQLIAYRVVQGVGAGGLTALSQVIMAAMISPRERGQYSGYFGAVMALGTIGGPLIGGLIVDTPGLGWRWCFYVGVPFAAIAIAVLQKTLHLPVVRREVKIDYMGATLITASVSLLLIWITLAGDQYAWVSRETLVMVAGSLALAGAAIWVEARAAEPVIPLYLFRSRTVTLSVLASIGVGIGMFGASVFLGQYFQISQGKSPTVSGLMTIPMIGGLLVTSIGVGWLISRNGVWKRYLVAGTVTMTIGFALMSTIRADTSMPVLSGYMIVIGLGLGMTMQNLVLAVQNTVDPRDLGAASSVVAFFRTLGGAIGVSVLGALVSHHVRDYTTEGLMRIHVALPAAGGGESRIPDMNALPGPIRNVIEAAYGHAMGDAFMAAVPFGVLAIIAVLFIKEVPLRRQSGDEQLAAELDRITLKSDDQNLDGDSGSSGDRDQSRDSRAGTRAGTLTPTG